MRGLSKFVSVLAGWSIFFAGQNANAEAYLGYQQLHVSLGGPADAEYLFDSVIEGSDGKLYGAAVNGGPDDGGVVFGMNKDGSGYEILHAFTVSSNGLSPWGKVIEANDGMLYGATRVGGTHGSGTVFRLNRNGTGFAIVRNFTTNVNEGAYPMNSVIEASDGRLYGRTCSGGTNDANSIFRLNKDGSAYRLLHSFTGNLQFQGDSFSGLIEGSDGLIYGTTYFEGATGEGSVFRISKDGSGFQSLHDFADSATDGGFPFGCVQEGSDGVLYGTTSEGGPDDEGTLYRINRDGSGYKVIRYFTSANAEGYLPVAPPVEGPGGLLYGSTYYGGVDEGGTLYSVRKDGSGFKFLREFLWDNVDGTCPNAALLRGSDGALYGTTFYGGGQIDATVFRIKPFALRAEKNVGGITVSVDGFASQRYALELASALPGSWSTGVSLTNITGSVSWQETGVNTNRFYRAQVLNP
jgi:uncharacterized repeat protein (TIGR03803 family)